MAKGWAKMTSDMTTRPISRNKDLFFSGGASIRKRAIATSVMPEAHRLDIEAPQDVPVQDGHHQRRQQQKNERTPVRSLRQEEKAGRDQSPEDYIQKQVNIGRCLAFVVRFASLAGARVQQADEEINNRGQ